MTRSRVKKDFAAGIDDNATSTAITIDADGDVTVSNDNATINIDSDQTQAVLNLRSNVAGYKVYTNDSVFRIDDRDGFQNRLTISNTGNVGIGGAMSPNAKLHVTGGAVGSTQYDKSNLGWFHHSNGNVSYLEVFGYRTSAGSDWTTSATRIEQRIDTTSQSYIQFNGTGNAYGISFGAGSGVANADSDDILERMRIDSSGGVRIGLTSNIFNSTSHEKLSVKHTGLGNAATFESTNVTGGFPVLYVRSTDATSGTQNTIMFHRGSTVVGSITTTGSSTSYNTSSDYRLKENVTPLTEAIDRVRQIPVHRFNFIGDPNVTVDGFLAHEVQGHVPEAVSGEKDGMKTEEYEITPAVLDDMGNTLEDAVMGTREVPDYQGIDQSKLVPLLTKAIQEQQTIIDSQTSAIADLTARLETLETN